MKKALKDLSKKELLDFIIRYLPDNIDINAQLAECACCGDTLK